MSSDIIIHPITKKRYNIQSNQGKQLLKHYVTQIQYGGALEQTAKRLIQRNSRGTQIVGRLNDEFRNTQQRMNTIRQDNTIAPDERNRQLTNLRRRLHQISQTLDAATKRLADIRQELNTAKHEIISKNQTIVPPELPVKDDDVQDEG